MLLACGRHMSCIKLIYKHCVSYDKFWTSQTLRWVLLRNQWQWPCDAIVVQSRWRLHLELLAFICERCHCHGEIRRKHGESGAAVPIGTASDCATWSGDQLQTITIQIGRSCSHRRHGTESVYALRYRYACTYAVLQLST